MIHRTLPFHRAIRQFSLGLSPCCGIPCKIQHIFEEKISIATKAISLGGDDGSTEEKMRIVVRDTLFAKTMTQRWLFVGLPQPLRDRVLDVQQEVRERIMAGHPRFSR